MDVLRPQKEAATQAPSAMPHVPKFHQNSPVDVRQGHVFISEANRRELREAVEVRFLKKLAEGYP
jgi:hypothetical protein